MTHAQSTSDRTIGSLVVPGILLIACMTNPSMTDFESFLNKESGTLSVHDFDRKNYYIFSLYKSHGLSLRRGEEKRWVVGLFGNFIPLKEESTW